MEGVNSILSIASIPNWEEKNNNGSSHDKRFCSKNMGYKNIF